MRSSMPGPDGPRRSRSSNGSRSPTAASSSSTEDRVRAAWRHWSGKAAARPQRPEIVGVLPVRPRTAAAARLAAAMAWPWPSPWRSPSLRLLFSLASSAAFGMLALPASAFVAHVRDHAVMSAGRSCRCSWRGVLALLAGPGPPPVCHDPQLVTIVTLVEIFIYLPSLLPALVIRIIENDPAMTVLPPHGSPGVLVDRGTDREVLVPARGAPS